MTQFSDERGEELREFFFETAQELLQSLNEEALKLEKHPDDVEAMRSIRRTVHTIKGDAAACGCRELSELAHALEDALAQETGSSKISLPEIAFTAADSFSAMLNAYHHKTKLPSIEPLRKMIRELTATAKTKNQGKKKAPVPSLSRRGWTEYEKLAMQNAAQGGKRVFQIRANIDPHCAMPIAARQLVVNALESIGKVLAMRPDASSVAVPKHLEFLLASEKTLQQVTAKCNIPTVTANVEVELLKGPAQNPKKNTPPTQDKNDGDTSATPTEETAADGTEEETLETAVQPTTGASGETVLRVDSERIDNVLNLVGELIIGKSMLQQALNEFGRLHPKEAMRGRLADAVAFQARVLNDLQRSVMKIRMVPVEQLFRRFPRLIRDVSKQCGKEVELVMTGQDTDLDKSLLDAITEPLTHIVRNAVSHGIENSEERVRSGKPAQGKIRLLAYHQGNQVVVEVSDDGRGIDTQKVRAKAIAQGLVTAEEAANLSEAAVFDLIFRPSFSTADEVTEISGRGVGLDVVQSVLQRLKGSVDIETHPGQGTTFRMKLPLTLAIIKALLFRVEQRLYAIPLNTVAEIARAKESDLHRVDNYEVLQLRKQVLHLIRLGRPPVPEAGEDGKIFVLVIAVGEHKMGLIVDSLEGEEELVIKAMDDQAVATDMVSGASILGDGRVVLILDFSVLADRFAKSRRKGTEEVNFGLLLSHSDRTRLTRRGPEVRA